VVGHGAQHVGEADAQVGLLQHVEQPRHRPAPGNLGLERDEAHRLGLALQRRHRDPATTALEDADIPVGGQAAVQGRKGVRHLHLHTPDESFRILRHLEDGVVLVP